MPAKRGPKPAVSDEALLEAIRRDLTESPFAGEGHRKVWARLKFGGGLRVSRKRVLRLMREHHLLSPYRRPQGEPERHDGVIGTDAPNVMWGTDATKVFTLEENYGWIFVAVEHWNAECVGVHVCKTGDRFAALEPVAQGIHRAFGTTERDAARGLSLRMDHGSQYTSDHYQNQLHWWGVAPSFAFLQEPETNGVAERFIRTLKEQALYGRAFRTLEEVRQAVRAFVERYNREWRIEKNGFRTPNEMRAAWALPEAA
jgi:transposase InsO family protein